MPIGYGDDQRAGTDGRLFLEALDQIGQGGEGSHGNWEWPKKRDYT